MLRDLAVLNLTSLRNCLHMAARYVENATGSHSRPSLNDVGSLKKACRNVGLPQPHK